MILINVCTTIRRAGRYAYRLPPIWAMCEAPDDEQKTPKPCAQK